MNIYNFVSDCAVSIVPGMQFSTKSIQKLVGTLRSAGFSDIVQEKDFTLGREILTTSLSIKSQLRTASFESAVVVEPTNLRDKFSEMIGLMHKGVCPRCKTSMNPVKLSNYEPANYCSKCRTTLWTD